MLTRALRRHCFPNVGAFCALHPWIHPDLREVSHPHVYHSARQVCLGEMKNTRKVPLSLVSSRGRWWGFCVVSHAIDHQHHISRTTGAGVRNIHVAPVRIQELDWLWALVFVGAPWTRHMRVWHWTTKRRNKIWPPRRRVVVRKMPVAFKRREPCNASSYRDGHLSCILPCTWSRHRH